MEHVIFVASRLGVREPVGGSLKPDTAGFAVLRLSPERVVSGREARGAPGVGAKKRRHQK